MVQVARDLLGKVLVTRIDGQRTSGRITETEAYRGPDDKACHAFNHRRTGRTEIMFHEGGVSYIYLCYGIHHLFNVVTGPRDQAHAVLIRAVEPLENAELMQERRGITEVRPQLTAGPGVMSQALGIRTDFSACPLTDPDSPITLEDDGYRVPQSGIAQSPRIGVAYAEECADWEWRFWIDGNPWVSRFKK